MSSIPGNWGPWKEGTCSSGCLEKSKGQTTRRRHCDNPTPVGTDAGCEGSGFQIVVCDDTKVSALYYKVICTSTICTKSLIFHYKQF